MKIMHTFTLILAQVLHLGSENPVSREWLAIRLLGVCVSVLTNLCQRKEHFYGSRCCLSDRSRDTIS